MTASTTATRVRVCGVDDLTPDLGVAALVGEIQVALFRIDGALYAVQNLCPFSGAMVMSRGITGSKDGQFTIASPIYKQVFSLVTGECLVTMDGVPKPGLDAMLTTYDVAVEGEEVFVAVANL